MTRDEAEQFVADYAGTNVEPTLTADEITRCIDQSLIVDSEGRLKTNAYYVETVWGTRAVVLAIDMKMAKASRKVDVSVDGNLIKSTQIQTALRDLRRSWRSRMQAGSV